MRLRSALSLVFFALPIVGCGGSDPEFGSADASVDASAETANDAALDTEGDGAGPVDCTGKADGTDCGGGNICLGGACKATSCGDGFVNKAAGEDCEDGNDVSGDGCSACKFDCTTNADCDDKNPCTTETCGADHKCKSDIPSGEPPCTVDGSAGVCKAGTCVKAGCGNATKDPGEECDDGNKNDADGCKSDCTFSCKSNADCDDENACNGVETCDVATHRCRPGVAVNCSPKPGCTGTCDKTTGACTYPDVDKDGVGCDKDCVDSDPSVFPGAFECADGKDNDCNAATADPGSPSCLCYADPDKDGYAAVGAATITNVSCPSGYTRRKPDTAVKGTVDCKEGNASVFPSQSAWFTSAYCTGVPVFPSGCSAKYSFDYDCDGVETKRYPSLASSSGCKYVELFGIPGCTGSGWTDAAVPACGAKGTYKTCSAVKFGSSYICTSSTASRTQECK